MFALFEICLEWYRLDVTIKILLNGLMKSRILFSRLQSLNSLSIFSISNAFINYFFKWINSLWCKQISTKEYIYMYLLVDDTCKWVLVYRCGMFLFKFPQKIPFKIHITAILYYVFKQHTISVNEETWWVFTHLLKNCVRTNTWTSTFQWVQW